MEFIDKSQIMQGIGLDSTAEILEKGKPAMIGEIREWSGKKYKKQLNGKWIEVSEHGMTKKEHLESKRRANVSAETAFREARRSDLDKYEKEQDKHREAIGKLSNEEVDIDEKLSHWDRISKRAEESKNWTPEQHKKKAKELNSQMIALEAKGKGNTKEYKELKEDRDSHEAKARKKSFLSNVEKFEKVWGKGDV